ALTELRYGGRPAATLRAVRAFVFAVPLNCLAMGYGMLAMRKVIVALGVMDFMPDLPGDDRLWAIVPIVLVVMVYTTVAGLWGVVTTDFVQYILAMVGAITVAWFAVTEAGGVGGLGDSLRASGRESSLDLVPTGSDALLPLSTFWAYLMVQRWEISNSAGGDMRVQRLTSTTVQE